MPAPKLETVDQAAAELGVHKRTLQTWLTKGRLDRYYRPGDQRTYVRISDRKRLQKPVRRRADPSPNHPATGVSSTSKVG